MNPNNALSAWQLAMIAVVAVATLAAWLTLVLLADRHPRRTSTGVDTRPHEEENGVAGTQPPHAATPPDNAVDKAAA